MEQRTLRLGDILDDYCPRERRVTNHAVVAMIEEHVKQTRCTTCEAEHAYKGAKEPRRRKKEPGVVLYEEVLAGLPDATAGVIAQAPAAIDVHASEPGNGGPAFENTAEPAEEAPVDEPQAHVEDGPFHRRLIRATLPRPEGQKDVRQVPDFTIRQNGGRGNGQNAFRGDRSRMRGVGGGQGNGHGNGNGSAYGNGNGRPQGGGRRFAGGGSPGGNPGTPGPRGNRGGGRPGFGPSGGSGRGPSTGSGRNGRKRSR
jgi:hypothetical protein